MNPTFKILQPMTCGFEPNELRHASEFPKGTDFKRLVDLGTVRPTNLAGVVPGDDEKTTMLDEIEGLQFKLQASAEKHEAELSGRDDQIASLSDENKTLRERVAELELAAASTQAGTGEPKAEPEMPPVEGGNPPVPTPPLEPKSGKAAKAK